MWLVQSLRREFCPDASWAAIADEAEASTYMETFDINDESFTAPLSMAKAISDYIVARGGDVPKEPRDYFNSAYRSLALGYKKAIEDLEFNTGCRYSEIFIVGGGAKCGYLNRLTEAQTGKKVVALPIEATAIGNLKVQMKRKI